ncbi:MAG: hypothetical protein ACRCWY_04410 [Cellulosilyticaceae bacterium]
MLHKIGLKKATERKRQYFTEVYPTHVFALDDVREGYFHIVSAMIDVQLIDTVEDVRDGHFVITYQINYKVFYTEEDTSYMKVLKKSLMQAVLVRLPLFLEGSTLENVCKHKKYEVQYFIEDLGMTYANHQLVIMPSLMFQVKCTPQYVLAYEMVYNQGQNNLFLSLPEGDKWCQKTFSFNSHYTHLVWQLYTQGFVYVTKEKPNVCTAIHMGGQVEKTKEIILPGEGIEEVIPIGEEQLMVTTRQHGRHMFYKVSTHTGKLESFYTPYEGAYYQQIQYCIATHKLFMMEKTGDKWCLMTLDAKSSERDVWISEMRYPLFAVDTSGRLAVVVDASPESEGAQEVKWINLDTGYGTTILALNQGEQVGEMTFAFDKTTVYFAVNGEGYSTLYSYDISMRQLKTMVSQHGQIDAFCINTTGNKLYYTTNERGLYDVYQVDDEGQGKVLLRKCGAEHIKMIHKVV